MTLQHPTDCRCAHCHTPEVIVITSGHGTSGPVRLTPTRYSPQDFDQPRPLNRQERRAAAAKARHA